jgi:penicillin-binding protein 2
MSLLGGFRSRAPSRNRPHGNLMALRVAVIVLFAVLTAQLARMQLVEGSAYAARSRDNHLTRKEILPARGLIVDRNGVPLVENVGVYSVTITPVFLPPAEADRYVIYQRLETLIAVPALQLQTMVKDAEKAGRPDEEMTLDKHLTKEQAIKLDEASTDMPGVTVVTRPGRNYIGGEAFSHLLGYVGKQSAEEYLTLKENGYSLNEPVGKVGVEGRYESDLRGTKGVTAAEQDAQGNLIQALKTKDPVPGNTVKLSIDSGLQNYITGLLQDSMTDPNYPTANKAGAVVMNAKTGELLALASVPTFDNNIFNDLDTRGDEYNALNNDEVHRPLTDQTLSSSAPGSTFKIVTAAAGLQEGTITVNTSRDIPSKVLEIKGENGQIYPLVDWKAHGPGINLTAAIAWSSNIYFFSVACGIPNGSFEPHPGLGKDVEQSAVILGYYARAFGFGSPTGLDIGNEEPGLIPSPEWLRRIKSGPQFNPEDREWYYANTCFMGIGQGDVTATPLQVARMTAAVANGGKLLTPHVAAEIDTPDGKTVRTIKPESKTVPVSAANLAAIRDGMHGSVQYGAGLRAAVPGMDIAGKTGTAEFGTQRPDGSYLQHAWFTGFYPFDDPQYVVTVYFDLGVGGDKAAPTASKIFAWMNENLKP